MLGWEPTISLGEGLEALKEGAKARARARVCLWMFVVNV